jgi:hypothetical protein
MIDEGYSADKIAFWIGDTPQTVRLVYAHMLEASSAPAAAAMDAALSGFEMSFATLMGPPGGHGEGTTSGGLPVVVRASSAA